MAGSIKFVDVAGNSKSLSVPAVADLAKLDTFADTLMTYSDAAAKVRTLSLKSKDNTAPTTGAHCTVQDKAIMIFEDLNAGADDPENFTLTLPGPKDTNFEVGEDGKKVTAAVGAAIQTALNTATGGNYRFVRGWHESMPDNRN